MNELILLDIKDLERLKVKQFIFIDYCFSYIHLFTLFFFLDPRRSWNFTVRTNKTQVIILLKLDSPSVQYDEQSIYLMHEHLSFMQFPYDPNYGNSQSLRSHTAADQLVRDVSVKANTTSMFRKFQMQLHN